MFLEHIFKGSSLINVKLEPHIHVRAAVSLSVTATNCIRDVTMATVINLWQRFFL